MITVVLLVTMLGSGVILTFGFFGWVLREHTHARRYRRMRLVQLANPPPAKQGEGWTIRYKQKGRETKMSVPGSTEAEAVKEFLKRTSGDYSMIVSIDKE